MQEINEARNKHNHLSTPEKAYRHSTLGVREDDAF